MHQNRPDDSPLWQAALAAEANAFGGLWDRHHHAVFRYGLSLTGDQSDGEDVAIIAFAELWRLRSRVRLVDGSVLPWLLSTAKNVARNALRSRRRYQALLDRVPVPGDSTPAETSSNHLDVIDGLDPVDRRLFELTAVEGLSLREASVQVGVSYAAARARISRARARVRPIALDDVTEG